MSLDNDKRELLKLKQGLIEESDIIKKEEPVKIELHGKKKIENFFYHYKVTVIMVLFFSVLFGFFIIEAVTKKRPDIDYMLMASNADAKVLVSAYEDKINEAVSAFCPDFDNNGYVYSQSYIVDLYSEHDSDMLIANQTRLFAEIQTGTTRLMIGNREAFDRIIGSDYTLREVFVNLSLLFPDNKNIDEDVLYKVRGSALLKASGIDEYCPDDMYVAVLGLNLESKKSQQAHERALLVLENIVSGNIINSGNG